MPQVKPKVAPKKKTEENGAIEVESGVEIPARTRKGTSHYPFATMEVGDSFPVLCEEDEVPKVKGRLSSACAAAKKKLEGYKFSVRGVDGGVRVWRTE